MCVLLYVNYFLEVILTNNRRDKYFQVPLSLYLVMYPASLSLFKEWGIDVTDKNYVVRFIPYTPWWHELEVGYPDIDWNIR